MNTKSQAFFQWVIDWQNNLPPLKFSQISNKGGNVAIISVDLIVGFVHTGALSSPRIKGIIPAVVNLFTNAYEYGVRNFVSIQDTHHEHAQEFSTYPTHAVKGTVESELIPELKQLPFSDQFKIIEKNSISPSYGTDFETWGEKHPEIDTFIVVGDCTDICVYLTSLHLKVMADQFHIKRKVIVPENCVQTYDLSIDNAKKVGGVPHDGDFLHKIFLYHMKLNGIEIVKEII